MDYLVKSLSDFSDQEWHQELMRFVRSPDYSPDRPRSANKKIPLSLALEFIETVTSNAKLVANLCYLSDWISSWYETHPNNENPSDSDDFPGVCLEFKSRYCSWFELKHGIRGSHDALMELIWVATAIAKNQLPGIGSDTTIQHLIGISAIYDDRRGER